MPVRMHFIDSEKGNIFLRKTNDEIEFRSLHNRIENYYFALRHQDLAFPDFAPGDYCAVKVYRSQEWYRGRIIENVEHKHLEDAVKVS